MWRVKCEVCCPHAIDVVAGGIMPMATYIAVACLMWTESGECLVSCIGQSKLCLDVRGRSDSSAAVGSTYPNALAW